MKKILMFPIFLLLVVLSLNFAIASLSYTGNDYTTPATLKDLELVTDGNITYYVYVVQNGIYERFCYADEDKTQIGCQTTNFANGSSLSYNSPTNVYAWVTNATSNLIRSASLTGSTTGTLLSSSVDNLVTIAQNDISESLIYANNTHFYTSSLHTLPLENIIAIDWYDNQTIIAIDNNRTFYEFYENGTLIQESTISDFFVPFTILDMYSYDQKVYIVTQNRIYEHIISDYVYIEGEYYSSTQCMYDEENNQYFICDNTQFEVIDGEINFYCQFDVNESESDLTRCNGQCNNAVNYDVINDVYYNYGECVESECDDDYRCLFDGYSTCDSQTSYKLCGNFDNDACLEYSESNSCLPNQQCQVTGSYNYGTCETIDYTSYGETLNYPSFTLISNTASIGVNENDTITLDTNNRIRATTPKSVYSQYFGLQTLLQEIDLYVAKDCDYQEEVLSTDSFTNIDICNNGWVCSGINATIDGLSRYIELNNSEIEYLFTESNLNPQINTNFDLLLTNNESDVLINIGNNLGYETYLYLYRNLTDKSLSVYEGNTSSNTTTLLFTDTTTNTYDDLDNIDLIITLNLQTNQYDYYFVITRDNTPRTYQVTPRQTYLNSIDRIKYKTSLGQLNINNISVYENDVLPYFNYVQKGVRQYSCTYTQTGCFTSRHYVIGNQVPVYNNYQDKIICVDSLNGVSVKGTSVNNLSNELKNYPIGLKVFLLIFIEAVIGIIFFVVGDNENKVKHTIGFILMVATLLLFIIVGLMPVWLFVVLALFVVMYITRFFQKIFNLG